MKHRSWVAAFAVLAISASAFASVTPHTFSTKVADLVRQELTSKKTTQTLVILKSQADLSNAKSFATREARIGYVYKTLVDHANLTQKNLIKLLDQKKAKYRRYFISNAILVENANTKLVDAISKLDEVGKILGNPKVALNRPVDLEKLEKIESVSAVGDNLTAVGADKAWAAGFQGQGIVVAGQDTGYQWDHPALKNQYRGWNGTTASHDYNWHDSVHEAFNPDYAGVFGGHNKCGYNLQAPCDDDQHGTHTMGTMVGNDGGENQIGMAPKAKWIGCRNMDGGFGSPASYLECFQFFLAPTPVNGDPFTTGKPALAPNVINNSWGCPPE